MAETKELTQPKQVEPRKNQQTPLAERMKGQNPFDWIKLDQAEQAQQDHAKS
ncbi:MULTISPECIES: hypothetical protein [Chitinibacter]|uniref:hypothetical protein n=1 Tax=Chitinibacter TaxID=230666 RepID=UPI000418AB52|nr:MULTISPECIES: hypothetical protein [Chitinibacter]